MEYKRLRLEFKDDIAILTLYHPEVLNAISLLMIRELNQAVEEIEDPANGARCLLMTGAGRGFSAGANLSDTEARLSRADRKMDAGEALTKYYNPFFIRLKKLKMPFVTAVNGPAAGVGMSLAIMGDLVLAARSSFFLQAFRHIGLIPDGGATYILPRLVGFSRAMELSLLGEKLPAEKALEWGLINRVYDDEELMPRALELCRELAQGPTEALRLIRKAYWNSIDNTYEQQLGLEGMLQKQAGRTEDFMEGVSAFLDKRPADFKGK
ncbi:MAG: enoyl-CoA hydratase/isomerase [Deltaproteobacteria bacterium]|nr:enoyl-CoA hydratase/isomerase [Deltaproteobacteria bacterium]MBW1818744.1 enoyl-CoA hydratase/isomerase [Deltaproteobacteria bacterium]